MTRSSRGCPSRTSSSSLAPGGLRPHTASQARSRRPPHAPDPNGAYAPLVRLAKSVARAKLVLVTSGDWDYRELVVNWVLHARRLAYGNALVLAMDAPLHAELGRRDIPSFDNSRLLT